MKIELKNVNYIYNPNQPFEIYALKDIQLEIDSSDFIGLIGHTGSGKSTLVQHLNGLMKPTSGDVYVDGINTKEKGLIAKNIRQKVGLVFQYPEHQLFEETVYRDVAFGPINLGKSEAEISEIVRDSLEAVGLDFEAIKDKSPFELSGGQKRRVAIAGVLALSPSFLVLDEPTAGLDPRGRDEILDEIRSLHQRGIGIVLVSHSMEDVASLVNRVIVMDQGEVFMDGLPLEIFQQEEKLESIGLGIPQITRFMKAYKAAGHDVDTHILTVEKALDVMKTSLREGGHA